VPADKMSSSWPTLIKAGTAAANVILVMENRSVLNDTLNFTIVIQRKGIERTMTKVLLKTVAYLEI